MRARTFVAIEISPEMRQALAEVQARLIAVAERVNWVEPRHFHLTLKFCGDLNEHDIVRVTGVMKRQFEGRGRIPMHCHGIDTFPPNIQETGAAPRVIWAGVEAGLLPKWVNEFDRRLMNDAGIRPEGRGYKPHVTIGRVKTTRDLDALRGMLRECRDMDFGSCVAERVVLYESRLRPEGPVYHKLTSVQL